MIDDNRNYVSSLVDNILKRDIEQRYKIAYKAAFENLAHHLLNVSPAIVVTTDLADLFWLICSISSRSIRPRTT